MLIMSERLSVRMEMSATRAKIIRSAGRCRKGRRGQSLSVTPRSSSAIVDSSSRAACAPLRGMVTFFTMPILCVTQTLMVHTIK